MTLTPETALIALAGVAAWLIVAGIAIAVGRAAAIADAKARHPSMRARRFLRDRPDDEPELPTGVCSVCGWAFDTYTHYSECR